MRRGALAGMLAVALIAGAAVLDEVRPPTVRTAEAIPVTSSGGTLACPVVRASEVRGLLHIANVADSPSRVRLTTVPDKGQPREQRIRMEPGQAQTLSIHRDISSPAGAIVEYAGGQIVASQSIASVSGTRSGRASAPCLPAGGDQTVILQASTLNAETDIALMNPGEGDAVVGVTLIAGDTVRRPERLRQRVVPARGRLVLSLSEHIFDERDVSVIISMQTGRVVALGVVRSGNGIEFLPGMTPGPDQVVFASEEREAAVLTLLGVSGELSQLDARLLSSESQGRAPGIPPDIAGLETVRKAIAEDEPEGATFTVLRADGDVPLAAAASWRMTRSAGRDAASVPGMVPATQWGLVTGAVEGSSKAVRVLIANPGSAPATVTMRPAGDASELATLTIEPGRVGKVILARGAGTFAMALDSTVPVAVAAETRGIGSSVWISAMAAVPLVPPAPVVVTTDPRLSVPAVLLRD